MRLEVAQKRIAIVEALGHLAGALVAVLQRGIPRFAVFVACSCIKKDHGLFGLDPALFREFLRSNDSSRAFWGCENPLEACELPARGKHFLVARRDRCAVCRINIAKNDEVADGFWNA